MFGRNKGLVGLDIGSSAVKAVELKASGKSYRVAAFASEAMAPDSIVDGAIIDGAGVADAIRRVFERAGTQDAGRGRVAVGQRRHRQEDQPAADDRGRAGRVDPAGRPSSTSRSTSRTSTSTTRSLPGDGGAKDTMDVLLVAAKKEKIADYTGVITQAGRMPVVVDVDAFALQNAFEANYDVEPGGGDRPDERRRERDQHQHRQRRRLALHARHVDRRQRLHRGGAARVQPHRSSAPSRPSAGWPATSGPTRSRPVLRAVSENVLLEIQKTFDFYRATARRPTASTA